MLKFLEKFYSCAMLSSAGQMLALDLLGLMDHVSQPAKALSPYIIPALAAHKFARVKGLSDGTSILNLAFSAT